MSYITGTIFRIKDDTRHITAVQLAGGNVLEVKNNTQTDRIQKVFSTLSEWYTEYGISSTDMLQITSKDNTIPIKLIDGYSYPKTPNIKTQLVFGWSKWLYRVLNECCPHLLERDDIKRAFNKMIEMCKECSNIIQLYYPSSKRQNLYETSYIIADSHRNSEWEYIRARVTDPESLYFKINNYSRVLRPKQLTDYNTKKNDFITAHTTLLSLITPELLPIMKIKEKQYKVVIDLMYAKDNKNRYEKQYRKYTRCAQEYLQLIKYTDTKILELEKQNASNI
jgi:hypothetical protein